MIAVTHCNPGAREAVATCHGPGDPDRREWERLRAIRFIAATAPAGTLASYEFRNGNTARIFKVSGQA